MDKILDLNNETTRIYKECFDSNESPKTIESIQWQFLENPTNKCFVDIAYDDENKKAAAIYAVSCVEFMIGNTISIGTQSLDTITDIDYRGKGLFIKLAKDVYNKAIESDASLVYGFPNGNSIYGFKNKLQWTVLDPLPFLIKPLKTKYFTNKIKILSFLPNINLSFSKYSNKSSLLLQEKQSFPEEVDAIWNKFSRNIDVAIVRDKKYLDWRYIQKPNENYKIVHAYGADNQYLGFVIYAVKEKHNGKIGYIMELIYDLDIPKVEHELMDFAVNEIKRKNADCILAWCFEHSPNYNIFKKKLFLNMPEKLRPIELHFGVRSFKTDLNKTVYDRKNWYLSYSDSDTV